MKYSVISLCCNRLEYTIQSVNSITQKAGTEDYEHVVVNQASSDGTKEWLDYISKLDWYKKVKPIHKEENWGYWKGFCAGFDSCVGDFVVFIDNDIVVETQNFLDIMWENLVNSEFDIIKSQLRETYYTRPDRKIGGSIKKGDHIPYPTAFYMMRRKDFVRGIKSAASWQHYKKSFSTDKVMSYQIEGILPDLKTAVSKIKYPPQIVYSNLKGDCPTGKYPHRDHGCESEHYK